MIRPFRFVSCALAIFVLLLSGTTIDAMGQERTSSEEVVRELMMYRVYYTLEQDGYHFVFLFEDPWPGTRSPFTGLFEGSKGAAKSVFKNAGREDGAADHLGSATVYAVTDSMVTVHVELTDTTRTDLLVYEGDVVELATDIPDLAERSVFFDLVQLSIQFLDAEREPLFGRETVLYEDGPALRDSLLQAMLGTDFERRLLVTWEDDYRFYRDLGLAAAVVNGVVTQLVITQVPYVHVWEPGN